MGDNRFQPVTSKNDAREDGFEKQATIGVTALFTVVAVMILALQGFESLIGGIVGIVLYFVPGVVAYNRKHNNRAAILTLNILLGWTVIGWAGALVWAMTKDVEGK